jgi:diguanylate cyclase (GGDEF)-like protein
MNVRRLGPTGRTTILLGLGLLSGLSMVTTVVVSEGDGGRAANEVVSRALPSELALVDVGAEAAKVDAAFRLLVEAHDPASQGGAMTAAADATRAQGTAWGTYLSHAVNRPGERELQQEYGVASARADQLGVELMGLSPTDGRYGPALADRDQQAARVLAAVSRIETTIYRPLLEADIDAAHRGIDRAHAGVLVAYGVLALIFTAVGLTLMRGARRDQRQLTTEAEALRAAGKQAEFEGSLQRALEMAPTEDAVFDVAGQALWLIAPDVPTEVLLADSSQAHFAQVLSSHPDDAAGCRATSPADCPAAANGQTRCFDDSSQLDTCRFLRGREDRVRAVCVPVSIAGRTTGVIHAQQPVDALAPERFSSDLELVARKVGERIGAVRVLARTEAQAQADPLTGLPNRRTLEAQAHEVLTLDRGFVVAFADLDHFKSINDQHGHETGDRALRLFARILRDSLRPHDLLARYGGEEFVAVLPDCSLADARIVGERIRSNLGAALKQSRVPAFTVSIGLAAAATGDSLADVIAGADAAMLDAKAEGRDRVRTAGEIAGSPA